MKSSAITILCIFGVVQGAPRPVTKTLYAYESSNVQPNYSEIEHQDHKPVAELSILSSSEHQQEISKGPRRLSLPTEYRSLDDGVSLQEKTYTDVFNPVEVSPPLLPQAMPFLWDKWTAYNVGFNEIPESETYNRNLYYVYGMPPYIFAKPAIPVNYLPAVSTHIHDSVSNVDDNYKDEENSLRAVRSGDEFFMEQFHNHIIPNFIPTMPVPYVREAAPMYSTEYIEEAVPIFAEQPALCAMPLLLSCSSNAILYGAMGQNYGERLEPSYPASAEIEYSNLQKEAYELTPAPFVHNTNILSAVPTKSSVSGFQ